VGKPNALRLASTSSRETLPRGRSDGHVQKAHGLALRRTEDADLMIGPGTHRPFRAFLLDRKATGGAQGRTGFLRFISAAIAISSMPPNSTNEEIGLLTRGPGVVARRHRPQEILRAGTACAKRQEKLWIVGLAEGANIYICGDRQSGWPTEGCRTTLRRYRRPVFGAALHRRGRELRRGTHEQGRFQKDEY